MTLTKAQQFLTGRVALLVSVFGAALALIAGLHSMPLWRLPFALFLWVWLGLLFLEKKNSLWLLLHRARLFCIFYLLLAGASALIDQIGLLSHLWFYPSSGVLQVLLNNLLLYPLAGLALIETSSLFHEQNSIMRISLTGIILAFFLCALPDAAAPHWLYLAGPLSLFLNYLFFGIPVFLWLCSLIFVLLPLSLWRGIIADGCAG